MRISVVIATAFRPAVLTRALASLRSQRDADWEAWVVDDGDGDGAERARALRDPRIHGIVNPGRGQVDARNAAIVRAEGDAICWLDDDDWLEDAGHLRAIADALAGGPALLHRGGWLVAVDDDGQETGRDAFDLPADADSLRRDNTLLNPGLAYPRALHRELGLLDRELDGYYDWDWYLRVTAAGVPLRQLAGLGVAYRVHPGNRSRRPSLDRERRFAALCAKHGLQTVMKHHVGVWLERSAPDGSA